MPIDDLTAIEAVRERVLSATASERSRVRSSARYAGISKKIAEGLDAGRQVLEAVPVQGSAEEYFAAVEAGLADARTRLDDPDDEDGWALGGLAFVRNRLREERSAFGS